MQFQLFIEFLTHSLIGERISQQAIAKLIGGYEVPTILTSLSENMRKSNHPST